MGMFKRINTSLSHLWLDESDTRRTIDPGMLGRLRLRVPSEARHTGEVRIYVESSLPLHVVSVAALAGKTPMDMLTRQRATSIFGKLPRLGYAAQQRRAHPYLLVEHAIELVADRGLNAMSNRESGAMVESLGTAFASGHSKMV